MYIFHKTSLQYQLVHELWKAGRLDNVNQVITTGNKETQLISRDGQLYWLITDYSNTSSTYRMSYTVPHNYYKVGSKLKSLHAFSIPSNSPFTGDEVVEALFHKGTPKLLYELARYKCDYKSLELDGLLHTCPTREMPYYLIDVLTDLLIHIPEQGWCVYQEDEEMWVRFGVGVSKEEALSMFESKEHTYYIGA